jgi:murein DD-endopeptidase MepM/ murein hydrolase activator NlpD
MDLSGFLAKNKDMFQWLLDPGFDPAAGLRVHLGKDNPDLASLDFSTMKNLEFHIHRLLQRYDKKFAYGGNGEFREFYKRSPLFLQGNIRTIHLGIDFWLPAVSAVCLPADGLVKTVNENAGTGNYGPTIISEHNLDGHAFYMLFGHLSRRSLGLLKPGEIIKKGGRVGYLGSYEENGEWPPHLHFQIIDSLPDNSGDYPGVAATEESAAYLQNCPDPLLIFNLD